MHTRHYLVLAGSVLLLGGILGRLNLARETEKAEAGNDLPFHKALLEVAGRYTTFGRVDDEVRWAPELCRMPLPGQARFSRSKEEGTHGKKLYSIFARKRWDYFIGFEQPSPVGQIIVKESWVPEEVKPEEAAARAPQPRQPLQGDHFDPIARKDGKVYKASQKAALFIMMRVDPKTPGTDEGWVYATVTADGKTVTAAGRVASCMSCHETRKNRLFGLRPTEDVKEEQP